MRPLPLVALLLVVVAAFPASVSAEEKQMDLGSGATYVAETGVLSSVKDLADFSDGIYASKWDLSKAVRLDNFVFEKDAAKWTLTGWLFLREPVRGIRNRAIFFGGARFEMTPPIEIERLQAKRFLGQEIVDQQVKQIFFRFTGVDEQQILEGLAWSEEEAKKAEAENEDAKKWLEDVRKVLEKGETPEQLERRRFREFELALRTYERILDPRKEGWLSADMTVKVPKDQDLSKNHLTGLEFAYSPDSRIEVSLVGSFKHEKGTPQSQICEFHAKGQYDGGDLQWMGTSPYIEAEDATKFEFGVPHHALKLVLAPGEKIDTRMESEIDIDILRDDVKALTFAVNVFTKVTKVSVDGKDMEFYQPSIPDSTTLHSPYCVVALPRKYAKGEKMKVHVDCESKIFERFDDATWQVNAELNWFPDPSPDLGDTPTIFDTTIRAPKGWTALANGKVGDCDPADVMPGMECYHYLTNIGIDFATINIASNMPADRGVSLPVDADKDGKDDPPAPITIWTNSTAKRSFPVVDQASRRIVAQRDYNLSENGPDALGRAQVAHKVYSEWFGPCPYDSLTITPHPKGHGRGSASLLCISQEAFLSNTAFAELASLQQTTFRPWRMAWFLSHEVGHQWWGGAARIRDGALSQWFSEGFAQYGSFIVMEERDRGANTNWFREAMTGDREYLIRDEGHAHGICSLAQGNRWASAENRAGYQWNRQEYLYGKGCMVMHALRMLARAKEDDPLKGDQLFKLAMRNFISECQGKKAPSNLDMMRSIERSYKMPLDWFWKQWIFGLGIPKVNYSYTISPSAAGGTAITVRVKQTQGGTPFQFPLAVSLWQGKQELGFDYQWVGKAEAEIKIDLPAGVKPDKVTVNEDLGVLGIFKEVPWTASAAGM